MQERIRIKVFIHFIDRSFDIFRDINRSETCEQISCWLLPVTTPIEFSYLLENGIRLSANDKPFAYLERNDQLSGVLHVICNKQYNDLSQSLNTEIDSDDTNRLPLPNLSTSEPTGFDELSDDDFELAIDDVDVDEEVGSEAVAVSEENDFDEDKAYYSDVECNIPSPEFSTNENHDPAPNNRESQLLKVIRKVTVRYYSRLLHNRLVPLVVVISKNAIERIASDKIEQTPSKLIAVEVQSDIEVHPVLPGCTCFPRMLNVSPKKLKAEARFWVLSHATGELNDCRIECSQNGELLAKVPLEVTSVSSTGVIALACLSAGMPILSSVMKAYEVDLESQVRGGFSFYTSLIGAVLGRVPADIILVVFLMATFVMYYFTRPKKEEVIWDADEVSESELFRKASNAFKDGDYPSGTRLLNQLIEDYPDFIPGLRFAADMAFRARNYEFAKKQYEAAIAAGDTRRSTRQRAEECESYV